MCHRRVDCLHVFSVSVNTNALVNQLFFFLHVELDYSVIYHLRLARFHVQNTRIAFLPIQHFVPDLNY